MEHLLSSAARQVADVSPVSYLYPGVAPALRRVLERYPVAGKSVLVAGSISP